MSKLRQLVVRRWRNLLLWLPAGVALLALGYLDYSLLGRSVFLSGWLMLALLVVLLLYNGRKKLPMLRLGTSAAWLQWHVYLGLLGLVLFLVHVDFTWPNGILELLLASLFVLVSLSGVFGLWLSRTLPPRLSRRGENLIHERIPAFRTRLRRQIEALIEQAAKEHGAAALGELYRAHLWPFLSGPRNFWAHLLESRRPFHRLLGQMDATERYLSTEERQTLSEIKELVRRKDDLDYQDAGQKLLKLWLLAHIPLAFSLLALALTHLLLVYAFMGGD